MKQMVWILLTAGLALAACRPLEVPPVASTPTAPAPTAAPEVTEAPPAATPSPALTLRPLPAEAVVTVPPSAPPILGEVPADVLNGVETDLEARSGVSRAQFVYVRTEAIEWSDGSLGCPQPGMNYTMALVPGYWVVVEAGGRPYDYRVRANGAFVLCEKPAP